MSVCRASCIPLVGARPDPSERRCKQCDHWFKPGRKDAVFCDRACARKHRTEHASNRKACEHCGRPFTPRIEGTRYCGKRCKSIAEALAHPCACASCGTTFYQTPHKAVRKYCSDECTIKGRTAMMTATRAPTFGTGINLLDHAPDGPGLDRWFGRLSDDQLLSVWVPAIVEQFGDGRRSELAAALRMVRQRLCGAPARIIMEAA